VPSSRGPWGGAGHVDFTGQHEDPGLPGPHLRPYDDDAVKHGVVTPAGFVTSAAVVVAAVFAIFGTLSTQSMKQMGVGLAAAVLIDAPTVRGVPLPA
jgi:uncharacterized membrane protein YdfJ with MMPL/SSD domain